MTPFLPTFMKASASVAPIWGSPLPAMVATAAISFLFLSSIGDAIFFTAATTASQAFWMPRARAMESAPAAIIFMPCW